MLGEIKSLWFYLLGMLQKQKLMQQLKSHKQWNMHKNKYKEIFLIQHIAYIHEPQRNVFFERTILKFRVISNNLFATPNIS